MGVESTFDVEDIQFLRLDLKIYEQRPLYEYLFDLFVGLKPYIVSEI